MRIYIKNKFFSLGGSSTANDVYGQPVYKIKGKPFSPTRKKKIKTLNGDTLYTVRNKFFNFFFHTAYIKDSEGNLIVKIRNAFSFKREYIVSGYTDDFTVSGDFFSLDLTVTRNGVPVGTIRRDFSIIKDAFILDSDEEDMAFLVAMVIAIDNIVDNQYGRS